MSEHRSVPRLVAAVAVVMYGAAWWLPVIAGPNDASYGRDAIKVAFYPLLHPARPASVAEGFGQVLSLTSGLTNVLFVVIAAIILFNLGRHLGRRLEIGGWLAAAVNLVWLADAPGDLALGYWLWLASFPLLALAIRARRMESVEHPPAPFAPAV